MIMSQINLITERTDYSYQITNLPQDESEE
jgi:hypothetical protein